MSREDGSFKERRWLVVSVLEVSSEHGTAGGLVFLQGMGFARRDCRQDLQRLVGGNRQGVV